MSRDFRIVIVGAGIAGLTMAVLLARSRNRDRLRVTLVDAAERPVHDPAGQRSFVGRGSRGHRMSQVAA